MLVQTEPRAITRLSTGAAARYGISDDPLAFAVLSDNIYRDKIRAVIREIACNAHDAHVAAGCPDKPIWVHLPNMLEPYFAVRDEGVGMAQDVVLHDYNTYFYSNKRHSNDFTGWLGLGSKSPFAYTAAFTLISTHDGQQTSYTAYRGEDGRPTMTIMAQVPSNAHNGVEVSFPVAKTGDFAEFARVAHEVLHYFQPRPDVVGVAAFWDRPAVGPVLSHRDWDCALSMGSQFAPLIVMGNVAYPVRRESLHTLSSRAAAVLMEPLTIRVPMGSVSCTPSREDLEYNSRTLAALAQIADTVLAQLPGAIQAAFDACPHDYAARKLFGVVSRLSLYSLIRETFVPRFAGQDVTEAYLRVRVTPRDQDAAPPAGSKPIRIRRYVTNFNKLLAENVVDGHVTLHAVEDPPIVALADVNKTGERLRFKQRHKLRVRGEAFVLEGVPADEIDWLVGHFATRGVTVSRLSALPCPPRRHDRSANGLLPDAVLALCPHHRGPRLGVDAWTVQPSLPPAGSLYVVRSGYALPHIKSCDFMLRLTVARRVGLIKPTQAIYGVTERTVAALLDAGCIDLHAHMTAGVACLPDATVMAWQQAGQLDHLPRDFKAIGRIRLRTLDLPVDHPIKQLSDQIDQAREVSEHNKSGLLLLERYGDQTRLATRTLSAQWTALLRRYPLLSVVLGDNWAVEHRRALLEYVQWRDAAERALPVSRT